ncbi:MAG: Zn-ribbon domain-containing OB-fold protein [Alphaproteobacteria bacterium]|nr:Zn-ribbon domain-containing OB-fold protein [Alphaproteobacteria bacterium]
MENTYLKPLPVPDPDSEPFWQGCKRHRLLLRRCTDCGRLRYPPGPVCAHCGSRAGEWREASGRGRVYSWIVVRHPVPQEVFAAEVPYVVALIELEEGVRLASNLVGCPPEAVAADMPVAVTFEDVSETISLPKFRPA